MRYDRDDSFPFDLNQMEFHLVQNRKENCHHDHIAFNMKGKGSIVFSVQATLAAYIAILQQSASFLGKEKVVFACFYLSQNLYTNRTWYRDNI